MLPEDLITTHFRLTPIQKLALEKIGLSTLQDLLKYLPTRFAHQGDIKLIEQLSAGENVSVLGKVTKTGTKKAYHQKIPIAEAIIQDETGKIKATWFHQAYLAKKLTVGQTVQLSGKVTERNGELYLANPDISPKPSIEFSKHTIFATDDSDPENIIPIYSETKGLSSGWFYYHIQKIIGAGVHKQVPDPIPDYILEKYSLPKLETALVWIHLPQKLKDTISARKRFSFAEIFLIQLERLQLKNKYKDNRSNKIIITPDKLKEFTSRFSFPLTGAQTKAISDITKDIAKDQPMTRLLEGDVGSGKTAVAATCAFMAVQNGLEVAYMVPTEILARQHFESFIKYFAHLNIRIGLLTGSECRKFPSKIDPHDHTHISKPQLLKWIAEGEIPIVIGTHALIQQTVTFNKLALAIIDEQHRFGVMQRKKIIRDKDKSGLTPHLLSMTATPIPRTLTLAIFGDLDLSLLDEMPAGRKPIKTSIISPDKRNEAYEDIRQEIKNGRQIYVICPRIDEPDPDKVLALQVKSVKSETERLQKYVFPEYQVASLHSKMKPVDKDDIMTRFAEGEINILVATSVIEVGVNVPNATIIIIEGAERFGLAQLHQLRGRVIRSNHQAYCYLFSDTKTENSLNRLKALTQAKNGFELAEMDLSLRGTGALSGGKQWGVSDIGMEAIKNIKMVEAARTEAQLILAKDKTLKKHPALAKILAEKKEVHFE